MILSAPKTRRFLRLDAVKIMAALSGLLYLFVAFLVVLQSQSSLVPSFAGPVVIAALPVCAYLAFRYPMIFPFALYVTLVPFDSLLQFSGGATIARLVAGATSATMILHAILLRRAFVPHRAWVAWGGMALYILTSLLWTSDSEVGQATTMAVVQLFLLMTVLAMYPATRTEFRIGLGLVVGAGVISALYAVHLYQSGTFSTDTASRIQVTSDSGVALDPNYYAASFILPIAIALFFTFYGKATVARIAGGLSALLLFVGLLLTGSRGAFIASVAIVLYFAIRSKFRAQVFAFIGLAGAISLCFPAVYVRFLNDPSGQAGSASGRTFIWQTGLHSLSDHWLFGTGIGSYSDVYDRNLLDVYQAAFQGWSRPPHSMLVGGLTELGVVGLIIVFFAWYTSFRQLSIIPKTSEWFGMRLAFESAIVSLFAMSLSIDPTYIKFMWLAHSLALMLLNQVAPREFRLKRGEATTIRLARAG